MLRLGRGEVNEEAHAHELLQAVFVFWFCQLVATSMEVAVLEQPASPDLLGVGSADLPVVEVVRSRLHVAVRGEHLRVGEEGRRDFGHVVAG